MRTAERSGSASWLSVPALVGILAGLALVIVPVAIGLFGTAAAADRTLHDVAPISAGATLGRLRATLDAGPPAVAELPAATARLQGVLGLSPEGFAARYPATAAAIALV